MAAHLARCNKSRSQSAFCRSTIIIVCRPVSQALDQSLDCYAAFFSAFIHSISHSFTFISLHLYVGCITHFFASSQSFNEMIFVGIVCAGCRVDAATRGPRAHTLRCINVILEIQLWHICGYAWCLNFGNYF